MSRISGHQDIFMPLLLLGAVFLAGVVAGVVVSMVLVWRMVQ